MDITNSIFIFAIKTRFSFYFMKELETSHSEKSIIMCKLLMLENWDLFFLSNLMKIIHIKLPNKRRKLSMFKIFGKNLVLKKIFILYDKANSSFSPFNYMCILFLLKYPISLHDKIRNLLFTMKSFFTSKLTVWISFSHFFLLYVHAHRLLLWHYKYINCSNGF